MSPQIRLKLHKSYCNHVDKVVANDVKAEGRIISRAKGKNDSEEDFHGKQKTADCKKYKIKVFLFLLIPGSLASQASLVLSAEKEKPAAWNDWSQADFDGDAERKKKFMSLMGARKGGSGQSAGNREKAEVTSKESHASTINPAANKRIQDDLQKQFESGMAARRSKQRGIGFKS
ncbi:MAG: small acidic protein family-domain-containing protein [Olpidium bornovanus]|uniref:Small acidic protein n=1 Tax=Olpidium bornovanus TaxID=278681 RepID=A0A8H8A065_9FUNG|nr:MAG: small acidic protein family-domain-containing protein [Olpidium bornovanus]